MKIGITGVNGFIGYHLSNKLKLSEGYELVNFQRSFFQNNQDLDKFVDNSDIIIHLAGVNRHQDENFIFNTNVKIASNLSESFKRRDFSGKLIFISSIHEENESIYGKSKLEARTIFLKYSKKLKFNFTALLVPNVFGPFCKPNYNSFIATFSDIIANTQETPSIIENNLIKLIYIDNLVSHIIDEFNLKQNPRKLLKEDIEIKVDDTLKKLLSFKKIYLENNNIPDLSNQFDLFLFNTFRSYLNYNTFYPKKFKNHIDVRGNFIEITKSLSQGQYSFSLTHPSQVRGNHFHTRKVERFAVVKGKALIRMRKIGTKDIMEFKLSGDNPSFIDMPIWHTHSIENIGNEDLHTLFWINEQYNPNDPDTFYENV